MVRLEGRTLRGKTKVPSLMGVITNLAVLGLEQRRMGRYSQPNLCSSGGLRVARGAHLPCTSCEDPREPLRNHLSQLFLEPAEDAGLGLADSGGGDA